MLGGRGPVHAAHARGAPLAAPLTNACGALCCCLTAREALPPTRGGPARGARVLVPAGWFGAAASSGAGQGQGSTAPALPAVLGALRLLAPQPSSQLLCGQGIPPLSPVPADSLPLPACQPCQPRLSNLRSQPGRHQHQPGTGVATPATDTFVGAINECGRRPRHPAPWAHISLST